MLGTSGLEQNPNPNAALNANLKHVFLH